MNLELTLHHITRLTTLYQIERSEEIIKRHKHTSNRRVINQALFELLQLKTIYNQTYGIDREKN